MDSSRRIVVTASSDPIREYTPAEEERLARNLRSITEKVHRGDFLNTVLDRHLLNTFHHALFDGVREHAGRIRTSTFGAEYLTFGPNRSAHRNAVEGQLDGIFAKLSRSVKSFDANPNDASYEPSAIQVAVWAHAEVIKVHPFEDGSGRTSRLLLDAILVRLGLRPVAFEVPKQEYRDVLNLYYATTSLDAAVDLVLRVYRALHLRPSPWL